MTDSKKDLENNLRGEFDHALFESLDFHSGMKDEVRNRIKSKIKNSAPTQSWLFTIWKNHVFTTMAAVAIIGLIFLAPWMMNGDDPILTQPKPLTDNNLSLYQGEEKNSNSISNPNSMQSWDLKSVNEAKRSFGNELLLPTYIPSSFKLDGIYGSGDSSAQVNKVIFTYSFEAQSYMVIAERMPVEERPLGFEEVDINGTTGYLKHQANGNNLDAELHWNGFGVQYMVGGLITSDEAVKIAKSFK
jgi:hypothetical protein